jgi:hypothetical protein
LPFQEHAEREAEWFFRELGGKVPESGDSVVRAAAARVDAWLRGIPAFHRGVFALRYAPRSWPTPISEEFGELSSIVVRLECALHPAVGASTEALEQASVERLTKKIAQCEQRGLRPDGRAGTPRRGERELLQLGRRAYRHLELAHRALARARGDVACVVPGAR